MQPGRPRSSLTAASSAPARRWRTVVPDDDVQEPAGWCGVRHRPAAPVAGPLALPAAGPRRPWRCLLWVDGVSVLASLAPERVKWPRPGRLIPGRGPAQEVG